MITYHTLWIIRCRLAFEFRVPMLVRLTRTVSLSGEVKNTWQSPSTEAIYPAGWILEFPARQIQLQVTVNLDDQEMRTPQTSGVDYWEGSVSVDGTVGGRSVDGAGYVELTGYSTAFNAPM